MVYNNDNNHWGDSMAITGQRLVLANKIKEIEFNDFVKSFEDRVIYFWKADKQFHANTVWTHIIKYSFHDNITRTLKLGKKFKNSQNGLYDFIVSGYSFGDYKCEDGECYGYRSLHGIMTLKVDDFDLYCYYKSSPGGCPSCGMKMDDDRDISFTELYMTYDIDNIVLGCMSDWDVKYTLNTCKWN